MNLKYLQTFLTLNEKKSFTKTAAALGCTQSAVTAQIRLLETQLGVRLFERIGKNVTLTFAGERLLPYARQMAALSSKIEMLYRDFGKLTIGVFESVANYLFGDVLKEFSAVCPEAEIFLKMLDGKDYCRMLSAGEIDLAIILDVSVKNKSVRILQKRKENIILAAASTHELSGKTSITPKDLEAYGVLLPLPDCPYRKSFEQKLYAEGIRIKTALETDSAAVIKESSLCGIGLGLLPEFAVKKELIYHMLTRINYKTDCRVYTQILIHPDKWISPELAHFIEIAKRHFS